MFSLPTLASCGVGCRCSRGQEAVPDGWSGSSELPSGVEPVQGSTSSEAVLATRTTAMGSEVGGCFGVAAGCTPKACCSICCCRRAGSTDAGEPDPCANCSCCCCSAA